MIQDPQVHVELLLHSPLRGHEKLSFLRSYQKQILEGQELSTDVCQRPQCVLARRFTDVAALKLLADTQQGGRPSDALNCSATYNWWVAALKMLTAGI